MLNRFNGNLCYSPIVILIDKKDGITKSTQIIGGESDCYDEVLKNASLHIVTRSGGDLKTSNWTTGESHVLRYLIIS